MNITVVFTQVLVLFLLIVVGYLAAKLKIVGESFPGQLSAFVFNITLPCSIVSAMQFSFAPELLLQSGQLVVIGAAAILGAYVLSIPISKLLRMGRHENTAQYAVTFSNFSFMGYPVAQAFFGDQGLFMAAVYSISAYVLVQSLGLALVDSDGSHRFRLKYVLNPPMVGVVIGFVLFVSQWKLPAAIDQTVRQLGNVTTPMAMVLVGLVLTGEPLKNAFCDLKSYVLSALRLVILPLLVFGLLRLCGFGGTMAMLPAVITAMPVAANIIIVSSAMGKEVTVAARIVMLSTLLSVVTIPAVGYLMTLFGV